jgi:hypothetical protein
MKFKPGIIFETICKKDYSIFSRNESYFCINDTESCCVLYKLNGKTEISESSHIKLNDIVYDNLAFSFKDFTKYFYTENEVRLLKLKKLNKL